jgi:glycosyltransferase involved in cell wall biosynthesis
VNGVLSAAGALSGTSEAHGLRVLHVITGLRAGGAERQLLALVAHTRTSPEVLALGPDGSTGASLRALGVPVHVAGARSNHDPSALSFALHLLRLNGYDAVHLHLFRSLVLGVPLARLAGVPRIVFTEHSLNARLVEGRRVTPSVRTLYRLVLPRVDHVVAVSAQVRARLLDLGARPERLSVVPNAVDGEQWRFDPQRRTAERRALGLAESTTAIGVVGRLERAKNVEAAVRGLASLLGPEVRLVLAGDGRDRTRLEELVCRLGVQRWTRFTGEHEDVPALLSALDLLVAPSPEETFALAVVEARLTELPVLYASCPALEELREADAGAVRSGSEAAELRAAAATMLQRGLRRIEPPAGLRERFDASMLAARLDKLYVTST